MHGAYFPLQFDKRKERKEITSTQNLIYKISPYGLAGPEGGDTVRHHLEVLMVNVKRDFVVFLFFFHKLMVDKPLISILLSLLLLFFLLMMFGHC